MVNEALKRGSCVKFQRDFRPEFRVLRNPLPYYRRILKIFFRIKVRATWPMLMTRKKIVRLFITKEYKIRLKLFRSMDKMYPYTGI